MQNKMTKHKITFLSSLTFLTFISLSIILLLVPFHSATAEDTAIYKNGMYCYSMQDAAKKEVKLIGIEYSDTMNELNLPDKVMLNGTEYTVAEIDINWRYYQNEAYLEFYSSVEKLIISENFTGTFKNTMYAFPNLRTVQFEGKLPPKSFEIRVSNRHKNLDILFLVPKGTEGAYRNIIDFNMDSYVWSDLYEFPIPLTPTIASEESETIEYGCFQVDGIVYQVIQSAKDQVGKVQLVTLTKMHEASYLPLPKIVKNNGYSYELTRLCTFSLVGSKATTIIVPDTVIEMQSSVFSKRVELLFLSKNCKTIPNNVITDENDESHLIFVSVPEGVTTIKENAFHDFNINEGSIILPTTIKSIGKNAVTGFKLVTFLNKKPISNITAAIKQGTTVKVPSASVSTYKKVLGKKGTVVAAKDVVKATKLTVSKSSIVIAPTKSYALKASLTKGSNETIFWLSTNSEVLTVSDKGIIKAKSEGTAYVIAYTRTSGLHQAVKVIVKK